MRRRFLLRLALAGGVMLLLCLAGTFVVCLEFRSPRPGLAEKLGKARFDRLTNAYERLAAALLPWDRDGDGASDGREWFCKMNPLDAQDGPQIMAREDRAGVVVLGGWNLGKPGMPTGGLPAYGSPDVYEDGEPAFEPRYRVEAGQRARLHGRLANWYEDIAAPPGCTVHLTPKESRIRLAPVGGALVPRAENSGRIEVPVARDGRFAFEVECPGTSLAGSGSASASEEIEVTNPKTGFTMGILHLTAVWGLPPVIPTVELIDPGSVLVPLFPRGRVDPRQDAESARYDLIQLRWSGVPASAQSLIVEVARDEAGAEWIAVLDTSGNVTLTTCVLVRYMSGVWKEPYTGPLKFRVVPVRREERE